VNGDPTCAPYAVNTWTLLLRIYVRPVKKMAFLPKTTRYSMDEVLRRWFLGTG
jgi:hypothetical protein